MNLCFNIFLWIISDSSSCVISLSLHLQPPVDTKMPTMLPTIEEVVTPKPTSQPSKKVSVFPVNFQCHV